MFTDIYFTRSRQIAEKFGINPRVRYNVFFRKEGILCGLEPVKDLISQGSLPEDRVVVKSIKDGESFQPTEPIMHIEGPYQTLVELETELLGYLALSGPATNMRKLVEAAEGVPIVDMCARHYVVEPFFAYAALVGGAAGTSTEDGQMIAQSYVKDREFGLFGSIPHCLNAVTGGSIEAAKLFLKTHPDVPLTVLTDFEGREMDIIKEAVEVFGEKLYAVRLDTHGGRTFQGGTIKSTSPRVFNGNLDNFRDIISEENRQKFEKLARATMEVKGTPPFWKHLLGPGVTIEAYMRARELLDSLGANEVKIVLSSGFNEEKIQGFRHFIDQERTVIGTGSWVGKQDFHATMDIVEVQEDSGEWRSALKVGREYHPNERLERVL